MLKSWKCIRIQISLEDIKSQTHVDASLPSGNFSVRSPDLRDHTYLPVQSDIPRKIQVIYVFDNRNWGIDVSFHLLLSCVICSTRFNSRHQCSCCYIYIPMPSLLLPTYVRTRFIELYQQLVAWGKSVHSCIHCCPNSPCMIRCAHLGIRSRRSILQWVITGNERQRDEFGWLVGEARQTAINTN